MKFLPAIVFSFSCVVHMGAEEQKLRVPIHLNKPDRLATASWPVTFGIPFKQGEERDADKLCIVDEKNNSVPCQIEKTGDWPDGSVRSEEHTSELQPRL